MSREWGEKATELMWRIKRLADPDGVLAPGVVLNRDPDAHLRNLKTMPEVEEESASACVECGFCEPVCPSRHLTTTPRQRIVLRREIARQPEGSQLRRVLEREYSYDGLDTCAADGSCRLACPLGIDTGKLVKELRAEQHPARAEAMALRAAKNWGSVEKASRAALRIGGPLARRTKRSAGLPPPAKATLPVTERAGAAAVYVPSCTNRIFGATPADGPESEAGVRFSARRLSLAEAMIAVSARAELPLWIPGEVAGSCCGLPWGSKGFCEAHRHKANEMLERLWVWSGEAELPVVIAAAFCTHAVAEPGEGILSEQNAERLAKLTIVDSVAWTHDRLLPRLKIDRRLGSATVHATCATRQMGLAPRPGALASALVEDVYVAPSATCCGFAGDRGFSHPELTDAATADQAAELAGRRFDAYLSNNRTCEIGLGRSFGEPYESPIFLLERLTRSG